MNIVSHNEDSVNREPTPYREDPDGIPGAPNRFLTARARVVPLFTDSKASWVKQPLWGQGLSVEQLFRFVREVNQGVARDRFTDVPEDCLSEWRGGYPRNPDLGVHLRADDLIVFDADVVLDDRATGPHVVSGTGTLQGHRYHDGRAELTNKVKEIGLPLPATLVVKTVGRRDGSHLPGRHLVFHQHRRTRVVSNGSVTAHCEFLTDYARVSSRSTILHDAPIAELPEDWALFLNAKTGRLRQEAGGEWTFRDGLNDFWKGGLNNVLCTIKGMLMYHGYTEEQANEAVRRINELADDPMNEPRLELTVLKTKNGWSK